MKKNEFKLILNNMHINNKFKIYIYFFLKSHAIIFKFFVYI